MCGASSHHKDGSTNNGFVVFIDNRTLDCLRLLHVVHFGFDGLSSSKRSHRHSHTSHCELQEGVQLILFTHI